MASSLNRRLGVAALIMTGSVALSRVVGYLRDAIIAARHGATAQTDAYFASFTLPDLMNYMVAGGALSITFIPIFSAHLSRGREEDGWETFSLVATTIGVFLTGAVILGEIYTEGLVRWLVPEFSPEQIAVTAHLTRIVLPAQLAFYWGGLIQATILSRERFAPVALVPLVYNCCIILGGLVLGPLVGIAGFSWGALAGAVLGAFALPLYVQRRHLRYRFVFSLRDPRLLEFVRLSLPVMLGFSLVTVDEWVSRYFGSGLAHGTISWLNNARRLMLVPIAVLGQAAGQATLPFLARLFAEGRREEMDQVFRRALSIVLFATLAAAAWMALLALPVVRLAFEHGAYTAQDSARTAQMLVLFAVGIPAWAAQAIAARAFYAMKNTLTPMLVSTGAVVATLPLYRWLSGEMAHEGLALSTSAGMMATAVATLWALRRSARFLRVGALLASSARAAVAVAVAAATTWAIGLAVRPLVAGDVWWRHGLEIGITSLVFGISLLAAAHALRVEELRLLVAIWRWRFARS